MKIKHYNDAIDWLTRPKFNGGGSVKNKEVLPKRKPEEELKKRKKKRFEKLKEYLENPEEVEEMLELQDGGAVRENISPMKSGSGNIIGYRVRSRKQGIEKFFSTSQYGSLEEALNAAKQFRKEKLGMTLTNEDYLKLRNANKNLSAKEFADFLNKSPEGYKPKKGDKFTKIGVKQRDQKVDFKTTRKVEKKIVDQNIKDEIYKKYLKSVKEGKREGSIIGLGREYFPGETKDSQQKAVQRILKEKGEDITKFKKTGPGTGTTATKKTRTEKLIKGKKFAGSEAGQLSDEIFLDIKAMNDKVKNMSLEDIAANKKYIQSMRLNASMENLSKGVLAFDKYKDLTDLEVAQKIKERAAANKFFDIEHISGVKGGKRNIYFPNNLQMATGNIGSFMDNFKRIPVEQPNNQVINQIDNFLSSYNLTVRDAKNNIRLGNKKVIEVTDGVSNIVADNFKAVNTPFEKQTVVKPTPSKSVTKQTIVKTGELAKNVTQLNAKLPIISTMYDVAKSIPGDIGKAKYLSAGFKTLGLAVAPYVAYTTYQDVMAGKNLVEALERNIIGTDIIGGTKDILAMTPEEREARAKVKQEQIAELNIDMPTGFGFIEAPPVQTDMALEEAKQKLDAAKQRVAKERAEDEAGVAAIRRQAFDKVIDAATGNRTTAMKLAGGGLLKQAGKRSGPPPEKGPGGLASLEDYARTMME